MIPIAYKITNFSLYLSDKQYQTYAVVFVKAVSSCAHNNMCMNLLDPEKMLQCSTVFVLLFYIKYKIEAPDNIFTMFAIQTILNNLQNSSYRKSPTV